MIGAGFWGDSALNGSMRSVSILNLLFSSLGVLAPILILIGGVVAFRAMRNAGSILLIAGAVSGAVSRILSVLLPFWMSSANFNPGSSLFRVAYPAVTIFGMMGWLMIGIGVLMLGFVLASMRRQMEALESIVAGSRTDGMA